MSKVFRIGDRICSFRFAFVGILTMFRTQPNAWLHALASLVVCAAGFYFEVSSFDWCWLVVAMMSVWTAESLNTALEFLADAASPEFHPLVKKSKDIAAAAVLISAIGASIIGSLVFWPYLGESSSFFSQ
jgi:diacylglycerol kinase (ATP)